MSPRADLSAASDAHGCEPLTLAALRDRARTWWTEEPGLLRREQAAMAVVAPDLAWVATGAGSWEGPTLAWPFDRAMPEGLDALLAGRRLRVRLEYGHAFPVTAPVVWPVEPEPSAEQRTLHAWHVNGDGSLCLLETPTAWTGREPAAELVVKAAGWFIEYLLMNADLITSMTSAGMAADQSMDAIIARATSHRLCPDGEQLEHACNVVEAPGNAGTPP